MKEKTHVFQTSVEWIGNTGKGTKTYQSYGREHIIRCPSKEDIIGSAHPTFRGDDNFHNPEDLFISSLVSCHMLWFLNLCATNNIVVEEYRDDAEGVLELNPDGSGQMTEITLKPIVVIKNKEKKTLAQELHKEAHAKCFLANSCNSTIRIEPSIY